MTAILGALAISASAFAADDINLTEAVRTAHAAGECGEPTVTGVGHASYPYSNAFDGITSSKETSKRWLSAADGKYDSAWAQYVAPSDYLPQTRFALSGYRLSRLYYSSYDYRRAPSKWEILGVLPDGSTEVVLTNAYTWGTADTDAVRLQTFTLAKTTDCRYRGFRFHPLDNYEHYDSDNVKFGLLEVEFFVSYPETDSLLVKVDNQALVGEFSPAVGTTLYEATTCTAPAETREGVMPYRLVGYTLEECVDGTWTGGGVTNEASSYSYAGGAGIYRLTWRYVPRTVYNLVPTVRENGFTATASGPTAGADWPAANAFDGITHTEYLPTSEECKKQRWLCLKSSNPYLRVDVDTAFRSSMDIRPVAYRLWRLYDANQGWERTPSAWTLAGVTSDGATNVLSSVSGVSWTTGGTDDARLKEFAIPTQNVGDYRAFVFTPSATQNANDYVGLFELEIIVEDATRDVSTLVIASADDMSLDCQPAVNETLSEAGTCTRTSKGYLNRNRFATAGYKIYRYENSQWVEIASDPAANAYEWDGTGGALKLEWQWGAADGCLLDLVTDGEETFVCNPAADARGCYDTGTTVSVTPIAQTDPKSVFTSWSGDDVPAGCEKTVPLVVTVDRPKAIRGEFTRQWKHVPTVSGGDEGTITDGNWSLKVDKDTFTPVGDYTADLLICPSAYVSGRGVLDLSTFTNDTGRILSTVRWKALLGQSDLTGLVLPPGLGRIGAPAFGSLPDLAFVEMPDSVVRLDDGESGAGDGGAFGGCAALERVKLSDNLRYLGHQSFGNCSNLTSVTPFLPASLRFLGSAFQHCTALKVQVPDFSQVETLANGCFHDCTGVTGRVVLANGQSVTSDGIGAFQNSGVTSARIGSTALRLFYSCLALTNVSCEAGLTKIAERAFAGCSALQEISADDDFASVTEIGAAAFAMCTNPAQRLPAVFPAVTKLGESAFTGFVSDSPDGLAFPKVSSLGNKAFCDASIASVDLRGSTFTSVPYGAFERNNLSHTVGSVYLPKTVTKIGTLAFIGWRNRQSIYFTGLPPTTVDSQAFYGVSAYQLLFIRVPQTPEILAAWTADDDFVALKDITDVEKKSNWEEVSQMPHLIGTWRGYWCFTWSPAQGCILFVK